MVDLFKGMVIWESSIGVLGSLSNATDVNVDGTSRRIKSGAVLKSCEIWIDVDERDVVIDNWMSPKAVFNWEIFNESKWFSAWIEILLWAVVRTLFRKQWIKYEWKQGLI